MSTTMKEEHAPLQRGEATWQRYAERAGQWGVVVLLADTLFGLAAGSAIAVVWRPEVDWQAYSWPFIAQFAGYMLAILLGVPCLLAGAWDLLRGRIPGAARVLAFVGPVVILFGVAEGSHLLISCDLTPFICQDGEIYDRWHQLHHTLVAGVPLVLLYRSAWLFARRRAH